MSQASPQAAIIEPLRTIHRENIGARAARQAYWDLQKDDVEGDLDAIYCRACISGRYYHEYRALAVSVMMGTSSGTRRGFQECIWHALAHTDVRLDDLESFPLLAEWSIEWAD